MKKIICLIIAVISLTGCGNISNTPTRQIEGFFNQYQTLDEKVLNDLDDIIDEENKLNMNNENKSKYRELIKKQYKNLSYKIKDEKIDGDIALVTAEITVYDFAKEISEAEEYKNNNIDYFKDENGIYDENKFVSYTIDKLNKTKEKVKYTLDLKLSKIDEKWKLDGVDSITEDKILGIYEK